MEPFDDADKTEKTYKPFEAEARAAFLLGFQENMEDNSYEVCHGATKKNVQKEHSKWFCLL